MTLLGPSDLSLAEEIHGADVMVIPAVGTALEAGHFEGAKFRLLQVVGKRVDWVDAAGLVRNAFALPNVPGGSRTAPKRSAVNTSVSSLGSSPQS